MSSDSERRYYDFSKLHCGRMFATLLEDHQMGMRMEGRAMFFESLDHRKIEAKDLESALEGILDVYADPYNAMVFEEGGNRYALVMDVNPEDEDDVYLALVNLTRGILVASVDRNLMNSGQKLERQVKFFHEELGKQESDATTTVCIRGPSIDHSDPDLDRQIAFFRDRMKHEGADILTTVCIDGSSIDHDALYICQKCGDLFESTIRQQRRNGIDYQLFGICYSCDDFR